MDKKHYWTLAFIFIILLTGRLFISGCGYLDDTDEITYLYILNNFTELVKLNPHPWSDIIFWLFGYFTETVIRLFQAFLQILFSRASGIPVHHLDAFVVPALFNVFVSLLTLLVFYKILIRLKLPPSSALLGIVLLGSLVNTNIYIRHILPYENSFLFFLTGLLILLKEELQNKDVLLAGLCSALGFTTYMGQFMFVFISYGYLVISNRGSLKSLFKKSCVFFAPFVAIILLFEILSQGFIGKSYVIYSMLIKSGQHFGQGSPSQGLYYVFTYFRIVEKWWGIILLVLFFIGVLFTCRGGFNPKINHLLYLAIVSYLVYGCYVVFFKRMHFYGRILHIYYPFIILGVLVFLDQQKAVSKKWAGILMTCAALLNYGFVIAGLNEVGYPRSAIYSQGLIAQEGKVSISYRNEMGCGIYYEDRAKWCMNVVKFYDEGISKMPEARDYLEKERDYTLERCRNLEESFADNIEHSGLKEGNYLLLNFCFFRHEFDDVYETYHPYAATESDSLIYDKLHFMSYPAYPFEYCAIKGQDFFIGKQLRLRVFKTTEPSPR